MNWRGIAPPTISSTKTKPAPRSSGSSAEVDHAELAVAARLLLVAALGLGRRGDGLPVGDPQLLGDHLDPELAGEPLDDDLEVGLPAAPQHDLVGLVVAAAPASAGSSSWRRCRAVISRSSSPVRLRAGWRSRASAAESSIGGTTHRAVHRGARVSPVRTSFSFGHRARGRRPRPSSPAPLLLPAQGLEHMEAFLAAGARVDEQGVGTERAREHLGAARSARRRGRRSS